MFRAEQAFNDNLFEILNQLDQTVPSLRLICQRANDNVWKYFTDADAWGRLPPQYLNVEVLADKLQLKSSVLTLVSLEEQDDQDTRMVS